MKRSVAVSLVLMGAASLSACGEKQIDTAVYASEGECVSANVYSREKCAGDFAAARASHLKTAPAYKEKADCEAEFGEGQCEPAAQQNAAGGNSFVPFMLGYMIGSRSVGSDPASVQPQALYRQSGKPGFVNANGASVARGTGPLRLSSWSSAARPPAASTTTLSRGGFGARAASVSA